MELPARELLSVVLSPNEAKETRAVWRNLWKNYNEKKVEPPLAKAIEIFLITDYKYFQDASDYCWTYLWTLLAKPDVILRAESVFVLLTSIFEVRPNMTIRLMKKLPIRCAAQEIYKHVIAGAYIYRLDIAKMTQQDVNMCNTVPVIRLSQRHEKHPTIYPLQTFRQPFPDFQVL